MARNLRALTTEELKFMMTNYNFVHNGDFVVVSVNGFNRKTVHPVGETFFILTKFRRINITKEAIDIWINNFESNYSLIEVQNAINTLITSYQETSVEDIANQLEVTRKNLN